ncbi:hypothetical protein DKX38_005304 [Salix brachista]|uniref:Uncharacterized protein n=1 Tax=Salix brachista TaxID=2182728 RepID=A0A5N5MZK6_9ROSI|nr:hypothetical protein DKX38_005304 [Salix brachista]
MHGNFFFWSGITQAYPGLGQSISNEELKYLESWIKEWFFIEFWMLLDLHKCTEMGLGPLGEPRHIQPLKHFERCRILIEDASCISSNSSSVDFWFDEQDNSARGWTCMEGRRELMCGSRLELAVKLLCLKTMEVQNAKDSRIQVYMEV